MAKKSGGLFTLLTGIAMGAAAVFFSKEENRTKAKKEAQKVAKKDKKVQEEIKKNPKAFADKTKAQGKRVLNKTVSRVSKKVAGKKAVKKK